MAGMPSSQLRKVMSHRAASSRGRGRWGRGPEEPRGCPSGGNGRGRRPGAAYDMMIASAVMPQVLNESKSAPASVSTRVMASEFRQLPCTIASATACMHEWLQF